jgi:UDP-GlcNAc:undecaprenyl-phosphate GlcNAc-1-phosphate transferase
MTYFLIFIFLLFVLYLYVRIAKYYNIVDKPNERSSHFKVTVRGGGIIFPIAAFVWFVNSGFAYPKFFLGLTIISLISFWDDIRPLSIYVRLIFQFASVFLLFSEIGFQQFHWWLWIICIISAIAIVNAFNFMDGINGITGTYSLSVISGLWLINTYQVYFIENEFLNFISISLIVFCIYNLRKNAIAFAGDVGAISISFILIFLLALLIQKSGNIIFLILISVYGIDSILTIIYRILNKENIFVAHRKHLYQLLVNELNLPHVVVALSYSILQLLIFILIFYILKENAYSPSLIITAIGTIITLTFFWVLLRKRINIEQLNKGTSITVKEFKK